MAHCPHCNVRYDETNETQPCCYKCGHPISCGCGGGHPSGPSPTGSPFGPSTYSTGEETDSGEKSSPDGQTRPGEDSSEAEESGGKAASGNDNEDGFSSDDNFSSDDLPF